MPLFGYTFLFCFLHGKYAELNGFLLQDLGT